MCTVGVCVIWVFLKYHAYMVIVHIPTNNPPALYYLCSIRLRAPIVLQIKPTTYKIFLLHDRLAR